MDIVQVGVNLVSSTGIFAIIVAIWRNAIDQRIRVSAEKQITKYKNQLDIVASQKLEQNKLDLQLQHSRQSIVHDMQKVSFSKLVTGMAVLIRDIEKNFDPEDGHQPLSPATIDAWTALVDEEGLFVPSDALVALQLFTDSAYTAMRSNGPPQPTRREIASAYDELNSSP